MALLGATVALLATVPVSAAVVQQGDLRITLLSQVSPYKLPRIGTSPISVFVAGRIASPQGGVPEQLQRLSVKVNRHARFQSRGLPVCSLSQIQPATTARAQAACGPSVVGSGQFWAHIVLPDQGAYPTQGRLLVFNGRSSCDGSRRAHLTGLNKPPHARTRSGGHAALIQNQLFPNPQSRSDSNRGLGKSPATRAQGPPTSQRCHTHPALLAHIFTANPFPTSFVIPFAIRKIHSGPYGTEFSTSLPDALGSWGYVDRIKLTLKRKYRYRGEQLSYFNAGCPAFEGAKRATFHLAFATFSFLGDENVGLQVDKACGVKE